VLDLEVGLVERYSRHYSAAGLKEKENVSIAIISSQPMALLSRFVEGLADRIDRWVFMLIVGKACTSTQLCPTTVLTTTFM